MNRFEYFIIPYTPFYFPGAWARASWYGVPGTPTVRIDGLYQEAGAPLDCEGMAARYRSWINQRLANGGDRSPVEISGRWIPSPDEITVEAVFHLVDPASLTNLRATLLIYEDDVYEYVGPNSPDRWNRVTRAYYDESIRLDNAGDKVTARAVFPADGIWRQDQMRAVAYLQQTGGERPIIQSARLELRPDFAFDPPLVRSVPAGSGVGRFESVLRNDGAVRDTLTLKIGAPFGDWPTVFFVSGDPTPHTEPLQIILSPGETRFVSLRVTTDAYREIRSGSFLIRSQVSGRTQKSLLRLFNGSHSILLVDDDAGQPDEGIFIRTLASLGALLQHWDVELQYADRAPDFRAMTGFDVVIWTNGWSSWYLISHNDQVALARLIEQGGSLFLTSQEYLDWLWRGPNFFTTGYLGIESWVNDAAYTQLIGIPGDPIGDGLNLPLGFPSPDYREGDAMVPRATGAPFFRAPDGSVAGIRHQPPGMPGRTVILASAFNAFSETDPDPNNARTVLARILAWLTEPRPSEAEETAALDPGARSLRAAPNPFDPSTRISFAISPSASPYPVRVDLLDPAGRRVARLFNGLLPAGVHTIDWNGEANGDRPLGAGIYFIRVATADGVETSKVLRMR